jgi:hypothetical protein
MEKTLKLLEKYLRPKFLLSFFSSMKKLKKIRKHEKSDEEEERERITKISESSERFLIELKQVSYLMQNKFDFIEKKWKK